MRNTSVLRHSALALSSLFILTSSALSNGQVECIHSASQQLAAVASCGDHGSLNHCFLHTVTQNPAAPAEQLLSELESCFESAGCTVAESQIEALWVLRRCESDNWDLRRRRGAPLAARQDDETTPARSQTNARQTQTQQDTTARQTPTNTRQQTSDATTPQQETPTPTEAPPTNTPPTDTLTSAPVNLNPTITTSSGNPNSPSVCFTETLVDVTSCPIQSTGPSSGRRLPCFQTTFPSLVCASGLICQMDNQGNPNCMFKESSLSTAGIVIAIFFAGAIAVSIISICFFCCRERREQRRLIRAAEAAKIAQEAKTQAMVNAKKPSLRGSVNAHNVDRQPLMSHAPDASSAPHEYNSEYQGAPGTGYGGAHGSNPFADSHDSHPLR